MAPKTANFTCLPFLILFICTNSKFLAMAGPSEILDAKADLLLKEYIDNGGDLPIHVPGISDKAASLSRPGLYLPAKYNKLEIPKIPFDGDGEPVETPVSLHVTVCHISQIDEEHSEIEFVMETVVEWLDGALMASGHEWDPAIDEPQKILDHTFLSMIWKPDIYIGNVVYIHQADFMGKPARLKVASNGLVTYKTRIKVRVACEFDFEFYPADTQLCDISFRSYSHNSSSLELVWRPTIGAYFLYPVDDNFDVALGALKRYSLPPRIHSSLSNNETFDALQFTFYARRRLSRHLVQTYIPSVLYLGTAWLCFMIPKRMIEVRLAITMTTLLTLTAMFGSVRERAPLTSYTKAIDIWMLACIAFVFLVLLHFSMLLWTEARSTEQKDGALRKFVYKSCLVVVEFIESNSFLLILLILVAFGMLYWSALLYGSCHFQWNPDPFYNGIGKTMRGDKPGRSLKLFSDDGGFWAHSKL